MDRREVLAALKVYRAKIESVLLHKAELWVADPIIYP